MLRFFVARKVTKNAPGSGRTRFVARRDRYQSRFTL
jgi:hypothetical protein